MLSLKRCLEHKLETQGLALSVDCINLLNHGLDVYLKKMIRPCLELARSRSGNNNLCGTRSNFHHGLNSSWHGEDVRNSSRFYSASIADFKVAMQSSPRLLGVDWPVRLEKICVYSSEECTMPYTWLHLRYVMPSPLNKQGMMVL